MSTRVSVSHLANPGCFLALGFGSGLSPWAPGTMGTLAALGLWLLTVPLGFGVQIAMTLAAIATGPWICGHCAKRLGVHDHPAIVWDEIAAMWLVLLFTPPNWAGYGLAFVLFRLFDIAKPWPVRTLDQRVHGGLGILLYDLAAALYAIVILTLAQPWL